MNLQRVMPPARHTGQPMTVQRITEGIVSWGSAVERVDRYFSAGCPIGQRLPSPWPWSENELPWSSPKDYRLLSHSPTENVAPPWRSPQKWHPMRRCHCRTCLLAPPRPCHQQRHAPRCHEPYSSLSASTHSRLPRQQCAEAMPRHRTQCHQSTRPASRVSEGLRGLHRCFKGRLVDQRTTLTVPLHCTYSSDTGRAGRRVRVAAILAMICADGATMSVRRQMAPSSAIVSARTGARECGER